MTHIIFFAPYQECLPTIEQVFLERPDRRHITHEVILDSFNNRLDSISADAIISRGFTAHTMKRLSIPSAELKTTGYDVIAAVDKCLRRFPCNRIAIVGAFNMVYGSESIGCVYRDVDFRSYPAVDETMLEYYVRQAAQDGAQAIVGGCSTVALAEKIGIPAVMIESGKEAINNAIDDAVGASMIARREKQKSNEIANIMNYSFQGIIATDRDGVITLANKYCYSVMTDHKAAITGQNIKELFPAIPFTEVIEEGRKVLSEIHRYDDRPLMVNCVPVLGMTENTGCVLTFQNIAQIQAEEGKIRKRMHKQGFVAKYSFQDIRYQDVIMRDTIRAATEYSHSDSNLLICGETGTGKELFAQSIHNASMRRAEPFVAINCAALPEELLESELFGYVDGAFTGAAKGGKMGLFEIAHKGTIFLDEIGDISQKLQSRLLRVLQEREIIRLGNDTVTPIDVRVISATNKNLREEVSTGNFRQDLLYRLDVLELDIPPLRLRRQDIMLLINSYIYYERERTGCALKGFSADGQQAAVSYPWPGNVRELRNFCERICILCKHEYADAHDVLQALPGAEDAFAPRSAASTAAGSHAFASEANGESGKNLLGESERQAIVRALRMHDNSRTRTAQYLQIDKTTLWRKMKKYGISTE